MSLGSGHVWKTVVLPEFRKRKDGSVEGLAAIECVGCGVTRVAHRSAPPPRNSRKSWPRFRPRNGRSLGTCPRSPQVK